MGVGLRFANRNLHLIILSMATYLHQSWDGKLAHLRAGIERQFAQIVTIRLRHEQYRQPTARGLYKYKGKYSGFSKSTFYSIFAAQQCSNP